MKMSGRMENINHEEHEEHELKTRNSFSSFVPFVSFVVEFPSLSIGGFFEGKK